MFFSIALLAMVVPMVAMVKMLPGRGGGDGSHGRGRGRGRVGGRTASRLGPRNAGAVGGCWIRTPKRLTQPLSPSPPSPSRCRQKAIGHAIQSVIVKK
jgi:hypothetical protein